MHTLGLCTDCLSPTIFVPYTPTLYTYKPKPKPQVAYYDKRPRCPFTNKVIFHTATRAIKACNAIQERTNASPPWNAYPCDYCCGFHVGHSKRYKKGR